LVLLSFSSLTIYFISQHYYSTLKEVQTLTLDRLYNVANIVATQIDGDEHEKMMQLHQTKNAIKNKNADIIYAKIHTILQNSLVSGQLKSPIYTYVYDSTAHTFNFGVTSSEEPYFRHQYASPPPFLVENREKGGKLETYKDIGCQRLYPLKIKKARWLHYCKWMKSLTVSLGKSIK
jgi:hypothetical protein